MKKYLVLSFLLLAGTSYAVVPASNNRSSFTKTNDTAYIQAAYLDKVVIGAASTGGVLVIYDSTSTVTASTSAPKSVVVSSISLGTIGTINFDNTAVSGIYYATTANTAGVTIIYKK